jgi:hypothetical protein
MKRFLFIITAIICILGFLVVRTGCEGGPGFLRGKRLRPISDSWFPLFKEHYAVGESGGVKVKLVGGMHGSSTMLVDFYVENASTSEVQLCQECLTIGAFWGGIKAPIFISYAPKQKVEDVNKYDYELNTYVIPAGAVMHLQGISFLHGSIPQTIYIDLVIYRINGQSNKFTFGFEVP